MQANKTHLQTSKAGTRASARAIVTRSAQTATIVSTSAPTTLQRRELARIYYEEAWSNGRVQLLDTLLAENHEQLDVIWQPARAASTSLNGSEDGRRAMKRGILSFRTAYPDLSFRVLLAAEAGDSVMVHWTATATNSGPIHDSPPSNKASTFSGITRLDFNAEGQICRSHVYRQAIDEEAKHFMSTGAMLGGAESKPQPVGGGSWWW